MSVEQLLGNLKTSVDEVLESADAVKGAGFANAAAGMFELMQAVSGLGAIEVAATAAGLDVAEPVGALCTLIGSAASRLTAMLGEHDGNEAVALAERLMGRHVSATLAARQGARAG